MITADRASPSHARRPSSVLAAFTAVAGLTVGIVRADPARALAADATTLSAELAVGALLVAAALSVPRSRFAVLLGATGIALPLAEWNTPGAGAAFSVGLLLWAAWPPLLAAATLRGPWDREFGKSGGAMLALAVATSAGVLGLACAAVLDPTAQGCVDCPPNRWQLAGSTGTWELFARTGLALTVIWTTLIAVLVAQRLRELSPGRRRVAAPVVVPAAAALLLCGAQAAHGLDRGFLSNDPTDRGLWAAELGALTLTAAGVGAARVYRRRTRARVARLMVELGAAPSSHDLRDRLAGSLGDPELVVLHRSEDETSWIDSHGRDAAPAAGRELTPVVAGGRALSALVHRRGLLDDPAVVTEIARAARLAFEHARLHALHRARLEQLQASRTRLVAAADAERRRVERDLHDGAQQRLVALAIEIQLTRRQHPQLDHGLAPAEHALRATIAELRDLAHGLYPSVLADEGLAAALESLAEDDRRLAVGELAEGRFPEPVESTAYFVAAEFLRRGAIAVETHADDGRLIVEVRGATQLSTRVEDRVGAAGGTCVAAAGGLRMELPCAS